MIIRILGEGQFDVGETYREVLDTLDAAVDTALESGDEAEFLSALGKLDAEVRRVGTPLDPATIVPSDLILPHQGTSLEEVSVLISSEGASI